MPADATARPMPFKPVALPAPARFSPRPAAAPRGLPPGTHLPPSTTPVGAGPRASVEPTVVSDDLAAALNKLAAEYAAPAMTDAPFVTAVQRQEEVREKKRASRFRLLKLAGVAAAALVALHFTVTRVLYRTPSPEDLEAHVLPLPDSVLPSYSSVRQPLQPGRVVYLETDRVDANRIRYAAEVTLRLRKPLYVPASTNGTQVYRQLQESLQLARQRDLKFSLFATGEGPPHPELPLLIQVSHRGGDAIVVRLPFEARRYGWQWRLLPPQLALRTANRSFAGDSIDYYAGSPYLIFGGSTMAGVRGLMREARTYIVAVAHEIQKRSNGEAVVDAPSVADNPAAPDAPAASKPRLTLEELTRLFYPNAPAVELPAAPAVDPNRPALDPNAPAVQFPGAKAP